MWNGLNISNIELPKDFGIRWVAEFQRHLWSTNQLGPSVLYLTRKQWVTFLQDPKLQPFQYESEMEFYIYGLKCVYSSEKFQGRPCTFCRVIFEEHSSSSCLYQPMDNLEYCQWLEEQRHED